MSAWEDARASLTAYGEQAQHDHCGYLHRDVEHLRLPGRQTEVPEAAHSRPALEPD